MDVRLEILKESHRYLLRALMIYFINQTCFMAGFALVHVIQRRKFGAVSFMKVVPSGRNRTFIADNSSEYHLDILMAADYSLYSYFLALFKNDTFSAQTAAYAYLQAIFEQVRRIYLRNTLAENIPITLSLSSAMLIIRKEDCPLMSHVYQNSSSHTKNATLSGIDAINHMQNWIFNYSQWLAPHNHAIIFTNDGNSGTQGMANIGSICRVIHSVSVVEDVGGMATAVIAAHELGHSLGIFHDEAQNRECSDNFLMATSVSGSEDSKKFMNSFRMSKCSIDQLKTFLV